MNGVCAILVNYKGAQETGAAAASVRADAPGLELVVVDNSEDTAETARLQAALPPGARLIVAPHNLGFGRACNLAATATRAPLLWLVNPDVRVLPGCLGRLTAALDADAGLAAVAPRQTLDMARRWQLSPSVLPTALGDWARECAARSPRQRRRWTRADRNEALRLWSARADDPPLPQRAISGSAMLVRRAALAAGEALFDPRYFMYYEDSDLCRRLRRKRLRMAVVPGAEAVHLWNLAPHKDRLMAEAAPLYRAAHDAASVWTGRAAALQTRPACWPEFHRVERSGIAVPTHIGEDWALELSPTPLLSPAAVAQGRGLHLPWPADALAAAGDAPVYGRLGPAHTAASEADCLLLRFDARERQG